MLTYGYESCLINKQPTTENTKALIWQIMIKNITKIQPTNKLQLKKGNKVYLHNKNFKTPKKNKKLDPIKDNPFVIEEILKKNNIKFQLPLQAQVHWIFHIFFLSKVDSFILIQTIWKQQDNENCEFEVEKIIDQCSGKYLIKWKNYNNSKNI